jgi:hypothetical protein
VSPGGGGAGGPAPRVSGGGGEGPGASPRAPGERGGSDGPPCQILLHFDGDGRLIDFTTAQPIPPPPQP